LRRSRSRTPPPAQARKSHQQPSLFSWNRTHTCRRRTPDFTSRPWTGVDQESEAVRGGARTCVAQERAADTRSARLRRAASARAAAAGSETTGESNAGADSDVRVASRCVRDGAVATGARGAASACHASTPGTRLRGARIPTVPAERAGEPAAIPAMATRAASCLRSRAHPFVECWATLIISAAAVWWA
jgi:hypothetical protein